VTNLTLSRLSGDSIITIVMMINYRSRFIEFALCDYLVVKKYFYIGKSWPLQTKSREETNIFLASSLDAPGTIEAQSSPNVIPPRHSSETRNPLFSKEFISHIQRL
jgi:hypothetical protein